MARERPNIVLINCDDLGYGDLGCYGSPVNRTPVIDAMAAEGARFTDFYMASPVCSPSRASMLTGCYPLRIGFGPHGSNGVLFPGDPHGLSPSEITFGRLLSDAGYATALIGKWHCGDQPVFLPTRHGFDTYFGLPYSNDMGRQRPPEGMTHAELDDVLRQLGVPTRRPPLPLMAGEDVLESQPDQAALTARYVERAVDFMQENRERPFLLYLAHMYVHLPIYVQPRFTEISDNGPYGAAVACIDWSTGVILDTLRELGLDDDTLVIFTSDNGALAADRGGGGSNHPLRASKGTTWEGGQRVPCIMRWPGRIPASTEIGHVATALDLLPTMAAAAGADVPDDRVIDGRDLSAMLWADGPAPPRRPFFFQRGGAIEAVRVGDWKLHVRKGDAEISQLYDLSSDISETTDLSDRFGGVVVELAGLIADAARELGDAPSGTVGDGVRPVGVVDDPVCLTEFDPHEPSAVAEYDLADRG